MTGWGVIITIVLFVVVRELVIWAWDDHDQVSQRQVDEGEMPAPYKIPSEREL